MCYHTGSERESERNREGESERGREGEEEMINEGMEGVRRCVRDMEEGGREKEGR